MALFFETVLDATKAPVEKRHFGIARSFDVNFRVVDEM